MRRMLRRLSLVLATQTTLVATLLPLARAVTAAPAGATTLALNPAFAQLDPQWLRGAYAPYVNVPYFNVPGAINIKGGAKNLDQKLHATSGPITVLAHSEGSEVADYWLRHYGPTTDISPGRVTFVLTGDPESRYGGCANITGSLCTAYTFDGVRESGLHADTPFKVTVFARQYDFYADCPARLSVAIAKQNRAAGKKYGGRGETGSIHLDYTTVGLADAGNAVAQRGNVTYIVSPTYWVPLVTGEDATDAQKTLDDPKQRAAIEAAYDRPGGSPVPQTS